MNDGFNMKPRRNKKEFTLFTEVISVLSVNIIAPMIACFEVGFRMDVWDEAIKTIPYLDKLINRIQGKTAYRSRYRCQAMWKIDTLSII